MAKKAICGIYAITPQGLPWPEVLARAKEAMAAGVRLWQFRDKGADREEKATRAWALRDLCRRFGAVFMINDDPFLAQVLQADGVHLGRDDPGISEARSLLGEKAIIGASCHGDLGLAEKALNAGADYAAFGSFYPSPTKPGAARAPTAILSKAKKNLPLPIVAIGGITLENAPELIAQGADALAVSSSLFQAPSTAQAARNLVRLFS